MDSENTTEAPSLIPVDRVPKVIGARLRALRKARNVSRQQLMDDSGIHWDMIRRIEVEGRDVEISTLLRLCDILGENPLKLLMADYSVSV
jgi:transcriptional regulator with XRE-family HTH domain